MKQHRRKTRKQKLNWAQVASPLRVFAHLNIDDGDGGLGLVEVSSHPVHCLWDEVQHQIQIHFIFLERKKRRENSEKNLSQDFISGIFTRNDQNWGKMCLVQI